MNKPYLLDTEFLKELFSLRFRETYVRLTSLTWDEKPVEQIEGKATGGSVNIDGSSSVRRTCSVSLIAQDVNINDFYWSVKTKFRLEIGLENKINPAYDDIVWFPQGLYIITSFSAQYNTNNYTINISGKDKMCLLNGDVSGKLAYTVDWGTAYEQDEEFSDTPSGKLYQKVKFPIKDIILRAMQEFGNELPQNIIINDLDENGKELIDYRGNVPIYLFYYKESKTVINAILNQNENVTTVDGQQYVISDSEHIIYDTLVDEEYLAPGVSQDPTEFVSDSGVYTIVKIENLDTIGYRLVELTYPSEFITNPGDTLITVFDKIKSMLGDFEYFYNIDGQFVFQKKHIYIDHTWNTTASGGTAIIGSTFEVIDYTMSDGGIAYNFNNSNLITSFSNSPNLLNLKNDFTVWGKRTGVSGIEIPIHMRYAVHDKPKYYYSQTETKWYVSNLVDNNDIPSNIKNMNYVKYDWRELIYQMAVDHRKYNTDEDYIYNLRTKNYIINKNGEKEYLFPNNKTNYEQYYIDMLSACNYNGYTIGYWRYLYDPNPPVNSVIDYDDNHWNKDVYSPRQLLFWIDFLEAGDSEIGKYSVNNIGSRSYAINDDKVRAIYYQYTPNILLNCLNNENSKFSNETGYVTINVPENYQSLFTLSVQGRTAVRAIDEALYQYTYCAESINLSAIPVYSLEPNTRIQVLDKKSGIDGQYLISRISYQLNYNGLMTIGATKAVELLS